MLVQGLLGVFLLLEVTWCGMWLVAFLPDPQWSALRCQLFAHGFRWTHSPDLRSLSCWRRWAPLPRLGGATILPPQRTQSPKLGALASENGESSGGSSGTPVPGVRM